VDDKTTILNWADFIRDELPTLYAGGAGVAIAAWPPSSERASLLPDHLQSQMPCPIMGAIP